MVRQGEYRLLRQGGGRTAFAQVMVQLIERQHLADQVIVAVDAGDTTTTTPELDPDWFAAAVEGCHDALRALEAQGVVSETSQVRIKRLVISLVDTCSDAVRAAAFLATATAFDQQDAFQLVFQGEWQVRPRPEEGHP